MQASPNRFCTNGSHSAMNIAPPATQSRRIVVIDLARGLALLAMAVYHFAWDLEFFGYAEPGMTAVGGWRIFARSIASSFLFLVGVSLVLAHRNGISWPPFLKRLAQVAAAAAAISLATWIAVPGGFIFFGILHHIALASLLGLAFLRLPTVLVAVVAIGCVLAPMFLRSTLFDHGALWWVGLSSVNPRSNDYVPLFPWFAAVLAGIVVTRLGLNHNLQERLATIRPGLWSQPLQFAGRHSLAFYLLHQPILIAAVWVFSQIAPPEQVPRDVSFTQACVAQCEQTESGEFCASYCICMLDTLVEESLFDEVYDGNLSSTTQERLPELVSTCTLDATPPVREEDRP